MRHRTSRQWVFGVYTTNSECLVIVIFIEVLVLVLVVFVIVIVIVVVVVVFFLLCRVSIWNY